MSEASPHQFRQTRWGYALGFELGDQGFRYSVKDGSMWRSYSIAYERFDLSEPVLESIPASRPAMLIGFCLYLSLALIAAYWRVPEFVKALGWMSALSGLTLLIWRSTGLFAVQFSVFGDDDGGEAFRVMRDRQHDRIVAAIGGLRRERLRRIWAALNLEEDLAAERARFDWLLANNVVDAEEYADAVRRISAADASLSKPKRLH